MKKISLLAVSLIFTALFAVSSFAQAQPGTGKIGWIVTAAFGNEKEGITKYVNAQKVLETEMKPRATELEGIRTRLQTISDDLKRMQTPPAPGVPVNQAALATAAAAKQEEGEKLQRDFDYKQKDAQAVYQKRSQELLGPITDSIFQALQEYAKQKGYSVVLDLTSLGQENQPSPVLVLDPSANITKDFITFYNARPATTATTTAPKQ